MAVKPGTPHPTKKGMVMGKNGRYVAKSTYNKQVKAANAPKEPVTKPVTRSGPVKGPVPKNNSAVRLPNSSRAGVNLPRAGASAERTYASSQKPKPKPAAKPKPSKPNPYTSGKPNPNAGGGVKGKPSVASQVKGAAGNFVKGARKFVGRAAVPLGMAAEIGEMAERSKRDAERNKKLGRRPFEELRGGNRSTAKGGQGNRGRNRPEAAKPKPKASDKDVAALTKPGGMFYQGPGKPKPKPKPARQNSSGPSSRSTSSKPKPKPQTVGGKTVKRVGPVSTPADKPRMNKTKVDKAMASTRKAYLKNVQEEAKRKSIEEGKKNRSRRNTTVRGPRERRYNR